MRNFFITIWPVNFWSFNLIFITFYYTEPFFIWIQNIIKIEVFQISEINRGFNINFTPTTKKFNKFFILCNFGLFIQIFYYQILPYHTFFSNKAFFLHKKTVPEKFRYWLYLFISCFFPFLYIPMLHNPDILLFHIYYHFLCLKTPSFPVLCRN